MNNLKLSVRDICFIGIFAAVISVMAVSIPLPNGVPVTLQTFGIMLAGIILGPKKGAIAVLVYILLGAMGVPVFSGFKGGFAIITGPTGGFILSFPLIALFAGIGSLKNNFTLVTGIIAGVLLNYFCGMVWFSFVMNSNMYAAFMACVLPFLPADTVKVVLAAVAGKQVKNALVRGNVLN